MHLYQIIADSITLASVFSSPRHKARALCDSVVFVFPYADDLFICCQCILVGQWLAWSNNAIVFSASALLGSPYHRYPSCLPPCRTSLSSFPVQNLTPSSACKIYASGGGLLMAPMNAPHLLKLFYFCLQCMSIITYMYVLADGALNIQNLSVVISNDGVNNVCCVIFLLPFLYIICFNMFDSNISFTLNRLWVNVFISDFSCGYKQ